MATIGPLSPGTPYHVRVIAVNSIGSSFSTEGIEVTTLEEGTSSIQST